MGPVKAEQVFDHCPWSNVYNDRDAKLYLAAYGIVERWREFPPGKRDPRLMDALSIIASEHNTVDRENLPR